MTQRYTVKKNTYDDGSVDHEVSGPGLVSYGTFKSRDKAECERITWLLDAAFEAGRMARAGEIRDALGIHVTPWGVKIEGQR